MTSATIRAVETQRHISSSSDDANSAGRELDLVGRDDPWTEQRPKCFGVPLSHRQF
ncbi:unnamed protein product, partial [Cladocopium goreaui]